MPTELDALFAGVAGLLFVEDGLWPSQEAYESEMSAAVSRLRAAHAAIDLPSLKRRLVIGDAAVEVLEADHDLDRVMESCGDVMPGLAQQRYNRLSAARARLRALREESDV